MLILFVCEFIMKSNMCLSHYYKHKDSDTGLTG